MIPLMGVIFSLFLSAESRIHKTPGSNTLSRTHDGILKMYGAFFNQGKCFTVILILHSPHLQVYRLWAGFMLPAETNTKFEGAQSQ